MTVDGIASAIDDVAHPDHHFYVEARTVCDYPVGLVAKYVTVLAAVVLGVGKKHNGKIGIGG